MKCLCRQQRGFGLIEMAVVIIVIGILTAVAMRSATTVIDDTRHSRTEREMQMLADAVVGNPDITSNGIRSDFGYIGDNGAFPPDLEALAVNPGGWITWDGPYIAAGFTQDSSGFKLDEWGSPYAYSGGITITSTGSGSTITRKIADATADYLLNQFAGIVTDVDSSPPGSTFVDSVDICVTIPSGAGSLTNKTYHPNSAGYFILDSMPAGSHPLRVIYTPEVDTIFRYITVLPRHRNPAPPEYRFASAHFSIASASGTEVLRPNESGDDTELNSSGCADNFECVDEVTADEDGSYVYTSSSSQWRTDVFRLEDHITGSGSISRVVVYWRGCKTGLATNRFGKAVIRISGTDYEGAQQALTTSWTDYSETWVTNPATGLAWTWTDIDDLEAGITLYRQGGGPQVPACTQVWVEVEYTP